MPQTTKEEVQVAESDHERLPAAAGLRRNLRKLRWYLVGLAAVAALSTVYLLPRLLGQTIDVYAVTQGDLIQTVVASGHIETPYRVSVGSQITGTVIEVPVEEGQAVKAGDVLIHLDGREYASAVVQAQAAVAQSEAKLRQIREVILPSALQSLRQAEATAANASAAFTRSVRLLRDGFATQADFDTVRRDRDIAETIVRNASLQVATNKPGGSDYVLAESQVAQARASLDTAMAKAGYTTITAPVDGRLISRNVERGNVVQPNQVLLELAPKGEIRIVLQIDERDLGLLRLGQSALASADAYPNQTFPAQIVYINPAVDLQQASVLVKLLVASPPDYLIQDMTVSVDIEVGRRQQALVVPAVAIHDQKGPAPWVLIVENGRLKRRQVALGLQADDKVEIVSGLSVGDLVVPATNTTAIAGQKVRVRILGKMGG
jgi:HlyD family secretion protein